MFRAGSGGRGGGGTTVSYIEAVFLDRNDSH